MSTLLRRKRWGYEKPPLGAQIDWGNPLSDGLVSAVLFNGGGQTLYESVFGNEVDLQGNPYGTSSVGPNGQFMDRTVQLSRGSVVNGGGTSTGLSAGRPAAILDISDKMTVMAGILMSTTDATGLGSNNPIIVASSTTGGTGGWQLDVNSNNLRFFIAGGNAVSAGGFVGGVPTIVTGTCNSISTVVAVYMNAKLMASGSAATNTNIAFCSLGNLTMGYRNYTTGGNFTGAWLGNMSFVYIWHRELKAGDVQQMQIDPYQIFLPQSPTRRLWVPPAPPPPGTGTGPLGPLGTIKRPVVRVPAGQGVSV